MTSQNFVKNVLKNADGSIATVENVGGIIFKTGTPLLANATVSTGWISYDQYASTSVIIYSDVIGAVSGLKYEYSSDAGATILDSVSTSFVTLNDFRVAIFPLGKGTHIRITYQNGSTPQTKFYLSVTLSLDMVNSMGSVFIPINVNNIASITKTFLQIPSDNTQTATYDFITRTGNSLNVNTTNVITGFNLESTQLLVKAKTDNLDVALSTRATEVTLSTLNTKVTTTVNGIKVDGSSVTQPISATSLPLPTGASTSVLQGTTNTSLSSIDTKTPSLGQALATSSTPVVLTAVQITALTPPSSITGFSLEATQLLVKAKTDNIDVLLSTRLKPSDTLTAVTTVTAVTAITNALPTGANTIGNVTTNSTLINGIAIPVSNGFVTSNTPRVVQSNRIETQTGSIETTSDTVPPAGQRIKTLVFTNNSIAIVYLQIFNKTSVLVLGDIPLNGLIFRVPANSTLDKTVADFGEAGILYGSNTRIGLSSTFGTYTAITPIGTSINIITVV